MSGLVERLQHCSDNTTDEYLHELTGRAAARIAALEAGLNAIANCPKPTIGNPFNREARMEAIARATLKGATDEN